MLKKYLEETMLADYNSPIVQKALSSLIVSNNTSQTIKNIYYFVRDEIKSGASPIGIKASETLVIKRGFSQTKGNLAIALFRGANIPARYRIIDFNEKKSYGIVDMITYVAFPLLRLFMPEGKIIHVIPQIFYNNKWINCDPLFDIELFFGFKTLNVRGLCKVDLIEWNEDTGISPQEQLIKSEVSILDNADDLLTRSAKFSNFFYKAGAYILLEKNYIKARKIGSNMVTKSHFS